MNSDSDHFQGGIGRKQQPKDRRLFRIFVSSTFTDMEAERDALQRNVFPKLEEFCQARGFVFQAVDLRWGVSAEAGRAQRTAEICLAEVERCQRHSPKPNFLILMGDRYGSATLPYSIPASEFRRLRDKARVIDPDAFALLQHYYRLDRNALPLAYRVMAGRIIPEKEAGRLRQTLGRCADALDLPWHRALEYSGSLTERELRVGLSGAHAHDVRSHIFAYERRVPCFRNLVRSGQPLVEQLDRYLDLRVQVDAAGRQSLHYDERAGAKLFNLKAFVAETIGGDNIRNYKARWLGKAISTDHLQALCDDVYADLKRLIEMEIAALSDLPNRGETEDHEQFAHALLHANALAGGCALRRRIEQHVARRDGATVLFVEGGSGSGKTTQMARAGLDVRRANPTDIVITRFVGATAQSFDLHLLLYGICGELTEKLRLGARAADAYDENVALFRRLCGQLRPGQRILILIDGADQMTAGETDDILGWVPARLSTRVKLVVSVQSAGGPGTLRRRHGLSVSAVGVTPLKPSEGARLARYWLSKRGRRLTKIQFAQILDRFRHCPRPLFLRLLVDEAIHWSSDDTAADLPEVEASEAMLEAAMQRFFDRLASPAEHGAQLVRTALGLFTAARSGLTEAECIELILGDESLVSTLNERASVHSSHDLPDSARLPMSLWVRLHGNLEPYLVERELGYSRSMGLQSAAMRAAGQSHFERAGGNLAAPRCRLLRYFSAQEPFAPDPAKPAIAGQDRRRANIRRLVEWPWQALQLGDEAALYAIFTDIAVLEGYAESGRLAALLAELQIVIRRLTSSRQRERLELIDEALRREQALLRDFPRTLFQTLWNCCWWFDCPVLSEHLAGQKRQVRRLGMYHLAERWRADKRASEGRFFWLRNVRPPHRALGTALRSQIYARDIEMSALEEAREATPAVYSLAWCPNGTHLAAGCQDNLIRIWQFGDFRDDLALRGHLGPVRSIRWTSDHKLVSYGSDGGVLYWSIGADTYLGYMGDHFGAGWGKAEISRDGLFTASADQRRIRVWKTANLEPVYEREDSARAIAWLTRSSRLLICGKEPVLFNARDTSVTAAPFTPEATAVAISRRGEIALGYRNGAVEIWSLRRLRRRWHRHRAEVRSLDWADDNRYLASGSDDRTVRIWDIQSEAGHRCLRGHSDEVEAVAWRPRSLELVSGGWDQSIFFWDLSKSQGPQRLFGHEGYIIDVGGSAAGNAFGSAGMHDGRLILWDGVSGKPIHVSEGRRISTVCGLLFVDDDGRGLRHSSNRLQDDRLPILEEQGLDLPSPVVVDWNTGRLVIRVDGEAIAAFDDSHIRNLRTTSHERPRLWVFGYLNDYVSALRLETD